MRNTVEIIKLKEMIIDGTIDIQNLSKAEIDALIDQEYENLDEFDFDDQFLTLCLSALDQFTDPTYIDQIDTDAIFDQMYEWNCKNTSSQTASKNGVRKPPIRILIAAATLVVLLTITISAIWNPFAAWVTNIRELFHMTPGETIKTDIGELTADTQYMSFPSIDDLEKTLGQHFDLLDRISTVPHSIIYTTQEQAKLVIMRFTIQSHNIVLKIYLENAPYSAPESTSTQYQKVMVLDEMWHISSNTQQYIQFHSEYVYVINADTQDIATQFIKGDLQ